MPRATAMNMLCSQLVLRRTVQQESALRAMFLGHMLTVLGPTSVGGTDFFTIPFQDGVLRRLRDILAPRRPDGEGEGGKVRFGRSLAVMRSDGQGIFRIAEGSPGTGDGTLATHVVSVLLPYVVSQVKGTAMMGFCHHAIFAPWQLVACSQP